LEKCRKSRFGQREFGAGGRTLSSKMIVVRELSTFGSVESLTIRIIPGRCYGKREGEQKSFEKLLRSPKNYLS
jgi:hypothetical protein